MTGRAPALAAALAAAAAALLYARALLPVFDFGDTASFQTIATLPVLVPRHAYPLYFALAKAALWMADAEPAFVLNALSAGLGALATGAFCWLVWELTAHAGASLWAALLLAASYTFWSQALIAEVYTLQILLLAAVLIAAVRWWKAPSPRRLAALYALYALSFGNHLSMILVAPALLWLLRGHALRPRALAAGAAMAAAGALQYAWNAEGLWILSAPRPPVADLVATFWFDVTKSDWRETLVGTVPPGQLANRAEMYWWDLRQQFGLPAVVLAIVGTAAMARTAPKVATALGLAFVATFTFAFFYNVGDTHVFLLPSHAIVAAAAGAGAAFLLRRVRPCGLPARAAAVLGLAAISIWRIADTWPAVDRSRDRRPVAFAEAAVAGLTSANALYISDANWQVHNGIVYYLAIHRPEIPRTSTSTVLWRLPEIVKRSHDLGRDIVLTAAAAERIRATYGERFSLVLDPRVRVPPLEERLRLPAGTPYVAVWMTPLSITPLSRDEAAGALRSLAGRDLPPGRYAVVAGLAGEPPRLLHGSDRPFRQAVRLNGMDLTVRIDAWLPFDTMRRAGFGHVIANGRHAFTIERGLSLVAFDASGDVLRTVYAGGLFAPQPRYLIPVLR